MIIVEDEWLIRLDVVEVLQSSGFEVIETDNANDALSILRLQHHLIHVLFTDVHMRGGMNGMELAHHARQHSPAIGILITSGHARPSGKELPAGSRFLAKPYETDHVVKHVRELTAAI